MTIPPRRLARAVSNVLNPFVIFTALFALVAFMEAGAYRGALYLAVELTAAAAVAGYVFLMRRRSRVGDFWISARAERLSPAVFLLAAFVALLAALVLLDAPQDLTFLTLSMGLASAAVAGITLLWKASAHCTVAGHATAAGFLLLGPPWLHLPPRAAARSLVAGDTQGAYLIPDARWRGGGSRVCDALSDVETVCSGLR